MAANRTYSKLFNTKQYNMYKEEFGPFKQKTYTDSLENMFNYQAHIWARENRHWFEMIRKWKPERLQSDFENYLSNGLTTPH